ncbi:MAG: hypothetical protein KC729_17040, partial [Candidatus Eisenbacteria bacterium]|nr:hypothetical protein [Candidatus Eisenbacteria bacterium]
MRYETFGDWVRPARCVGALALMVLGALGTGTPARGLEAQRIRPRPDDPWRDGPQVTLSYYNLCTGWVWHWNQLEFRDREVVGTTLEVPTDYDALVGQWTFFAYGLFGRGFCVGRVATVSGGVADSV